ncbi:MAG: hypothetical protein ACRCUT_11130, partial [Spirochaetota bacterium]
VSSILTSSLGNTLSNVRRQIQRNDLSDARNKFSLYQRTHMPDDETAAAEKELILKLAEDHYQKAGKLLSEESVAEAYAHSGKSVKYNPDNEDYQELYKKILEEYTALKKKEYKTVIKESEKMYAAGRLDAAQKHLNRYITTEGTRFIDESYYALINNIKKAVLASQCDKADDAISSLPYFLPFRTFTYNEFISYNSTISGSRDLLLAVLEEEPENKRALGLLDDANDAARHISRGAESQKEDDAFSSYLRQYRWHLDAGLKSQTFNMPASPLSPEEPCLGIKLEGGLRNNQDENIILMLQSSLSYVRGTEKRSINNAEYELSCSSTALTLEILPGYRVESFCFFIGPVFQADFLVRSAVNDADRNDKISARFSTAIGAGVDFRIEWLYSENILAFASYEYIPSLGIGVPDVVFSQYCFGAGYLF